MRTIYIHDRNSGLFLFSKHLTVLILLLLLPLIIIIIILMLALIIIILTTVLVVFFITVIVITATTMIVPTKIIKMTVKMTITIALLTIIKLAPYF